MYEQSPTEEQINECRFQEDEDDEDCPSGFDYEKLENFIENAEMIILSISRINATAE